LQGLRDIKDIVEVHDQSLTVFIAVVILFLILSIFSYYLYKNRRIRRKKPTKRELALQRLKSMDFDDVKSSVYTFSVDGFLFTNENNIDRFKTIEKELQKYKYKKTVPTLDKDLKKMMQEFIRELK
jgi:flagellar biosynthesis/type III secretory pathway M-ring protein FliF/YscJ